MYRILTFTDFAWTAADFEFDCLEHALALVVSAPFSAPWRVQEWIDIRNGPAEAGFWRDVEWWLAGKEYRATTERIT